MIDNNFQRKIEKNIQKVCKYLNIGSSIKDIDIDLFLFDNVNSNNEQEKAREIYKICGLVVYRQQEIFSRTGIMVPLKDIMKEAILKGSNKLQRNL